MRGKEKCKALKEIRRQIAEENDIPFAVSQCTHQGDCKGTCPKCESELRYLERQLAIRQGLGKAVAVVGISTSVCAGLTACSPMDVIRNAGFGVEETGGATSLPGDPDELAGDMQELDSWSEEAEGEQETDAPDGMMPEETGETGEDFGSEETGEAETEPETGEVLSAEEFTTSELAGDIAIEETGEELP